jgi:hypothetical protein
MWINSLACRSASGPHADSHGLRGNPIFDVDVLAGKTAKPIHLELQTDQPGILFVIIRLPYVTMVILLSVIEHAQDRDVAI